eukprot:COSAG02_NODE_3379_length_6839_cov_2.979970_1_plen_417_part_10
MGASRYTVGWAANSWGGAACDTQSNCWVQARISAIAVSRNGTTFTNSGWDEGGNGAGVFYPNGSLAGGMRQNHFAPGLLGTGPAASDDQYVYLCSKTVHEKNASFGVSRWHATPSTSINPGSKQTEFLPAPFSGAGGPFDNLLAVNASAIAACSGLLYLYDNASKVLATYDAATMRRTSAVAFVPPATSLACGPSPASVYAIAGGVVVQWSLGTANARTVACDAVHPTALAFDKLSQTLLVGDSAPFDGMVVRFYSLDPNRQQAVARFGQPGGVYAGSEPGRVRDTAFLEITGVGTDDAGALYVASGPKADLRRFVCGALQRQCATRPASPAEWVAALPDYALVWHRYNQYWQETGDFGAQCPSTLYTSDSAFSVNLSQPIAPFSGFSEWIGHTLNPYLYPDDLRLHGHMVGTTWTR